MTYHPPRGITPNEVWHINQQTNQIGGETDGVSPEVMEDIGYRPPRPEDETESPLVTPEVPTELAASGLSETMSVEERFVKRAARIRASRRKKAGKPLSQTPDAVRARERREKKDIAVAENISANADPWGK